jgi:hypothetical protein
MKQASAVCALLTSSLLCPALADEPFVLPKAAAPTWQLIPKIDRNAATITGGHMLPVLAEDKDDSEPYQDQAGATRSDRGCLHVPGADSGRQET